MEEAGNRRADEDEAKEKGETVCDTEDDVTPNP